MTQEHPSLPEMQVIAPPRPEHATDRYDGPTLLYRLYDADDRLLYIGVTCNPPSRWDGHRADKPWWPLVARKELTTYPDRSAALTAEREAIRTENPLHNIAGHPQNQRVHVHLVLTEERAAKLHALRMHHRRGNSEMMYDLLDAAPMPGELPAPEPSELEAAISVAQQLLDSDQILSVREALRLLLRALDAEPPAQPRGLSCPAAHPEDPTPCPGPIAVTVVDRTNAGADGCEHHGARLLASIDGGRVYPLPDAPEGAAIRVFKAADSIRPFPWVDGPRTRDSQLSRAEVRAKGERP